jgi:catechol 2,3-dioxygenase-like lactoylglutathione lyase family enzyme
VKAGKLQAGSRQPDRRRIRDVAQLFSISPRLHIADFARSVVFYRDVLGFTVDAVFPEERPSFALLTRDGTGMQIGGPDAVKRDGDAPSVTLYLDVDDARAEHARLKHLVAIEWGPEVFFYQRREFAFSDPDGHLIIVSEETDDPPTFTEADH